MSPTVNQIEAAMPAAASSTIVAMVERGSLPSASDGRRSRTLPSNRSAHAASRAKIAKPTATTSIPGPGSGIMMTPSTTTLNPKPIRTIRSIELRHAF